MPRLELNGKRRLGRAATVLTVLGLLAVAGCGSDGDGPTSPATSGDFEVLAAIPLDRDWAPGLLRAGYPIPADPDLCVANVMDAYGARHLDVYRRMLHAEFTFVLVPGVVEEYQLPNPTFDVKDESLIAWRLMSGYPSEVSGRAVSGITVQSCEPTATWQPVPSDDPYFGGAVSTMMRPYDVALRFTITGGGFSYVTRGSVIFYVAPVEVEVDGTPRTAYQLAGQWDSGSGPGATEDATWSSVKAMYWLSDPLP